MATSSRQTTIFGVNDWKSIYKNYSQADLQSYDYETIRKTMVDYLRTNYPETFNDYVESSEYVALLDVMSFMGQALAFRNDLNTRENFIDTAERRDSVVKLANLVGYNPKRNIAGQGFLKLVAISTTEQVKDINSYPLNNVTVLWNDPANINWQDQINTILNAALVDGQRVGRPGHSANILEIKTDEYSVRLPTGSTPAISFSTTVDGENMNFEGVSVSSLGKNHLYELSPGVNDVFNLIYRNDKLGYSSPNTGFFMYFKQGTLQNYTFSTTTQIANQSIDINVQGINDADTWLYEIDPITGEYIEWEQVESIYANTATNKNKKVFSVSSRYNDQVTYNFGDGVFGDMPLGNFTAIIRSSNAMSYVIDPSEMQGTTIAMPYLSKAGRIETLTLTLSLTLSSSTAQTRESLANIKQRAPQRYYTQNRMVNGEDYNNFPFTLYSSIIKSKAINRSSAGASRNLDLLDPSAKYSSTTDFADDGGMYMDINDGYVVFTASTTNDMVTFLTETLASVLNGNRSYQYYAQAYTRYKLDDTENLIYWNQTAYNAAESTGYFKNRSGSPLNIGVFVSTNAKYITPGAMIKFVAPAGKYFVNNRLVSGIPGPTDVTAIWTSVAAVSGDGSNDGLGNLSDGTGPVSLTNSIPDGSVVSQVLPSFTNNFSTEMIQEIITNITLSNDFSLVFNNIMLSNQERWSLSTYDDASYFVRFRSIGYGKYVVSYRSLAYYFGSVSDIRFAFDRDKVIYDPSSGKLMQDSITVLKCNSKFGSSVSLATDIKLNVVGQTIESDGYVDDFSVEVSSQGLFKSGTYKTPDFFYDVTGYQTNTRNLLHFTFFKIITDVNMLTRVEMVPSASVIHNYGTQADIGIVKYEFPVGQIFYAVLEDKFYQSVNDTTSANIVNLELLSNYAAKIGRQGLYFQYKHISSDTNRIDPATSNIIDLYVLTQNYYTQYRNWLLDNTGTIVEPSRPTTNELIQLYDKVNDYKMVSDNLVLNSVRFKPLFGDKAESKLRATLKVIKSSTTNASESEIKSAILRELDNYFNIDNWDFGDKFYFSELSAYLHTTLGDLINSVVLVPNDPSLSFGDLYEINSAPYEIFVNAAQASDIFVISALTPAELQPAK